MQSNAKTLALRALRLRLPRVPQLAQVPGVRVLCLALALSAPSAVPPLLAGLPGEPSAASVLDGFYQFPATPKAFAFKPGTDLSGFAAEALGGMPEPGVHPRLLLGPGDLPDLRRRLKDTGVGRALHDTLRRRLDGALRNPKNWGGTFYDALAAGDLERARALLDEHKGPPPQLGHYQPWLYAIVLEAFDALISEDAARGARAAAAVTSYAALLEPSITRVLETPQSDDVWRAKTSGPTTGTGVSNQGLRDGVGGHLLGYAYDFAHPFMNEEQRATVRRLIARATAGKLWMGARLPHHFRNWNWIAVGLQQPLLALSIEGEEGYDPRVYRLGVEIARDYLTYGISPAGVSTEAVGYTQFGLVWANPFLVAAARRGDNLLGHSHHRAMLDWYLHTGLPARDGWSSHGDGGDAGPSIMTLSLWRRFFPGDPRTTVLWRSLALDQKEKLLADDFHLVEPMLWAVDDPGLGDPKLAATQVPASLDLPTTLLDPVRGSLVARTDWSPDAALLQFECRVDSVGASHEHADRGMFTFAALGRTWAKDNFRSVETRHHNSVLIDGRGQGYWPGPGRWLGQVITPEVVIAACDAKDAYDWFWPKQILTESPESWPQFKLPRWESYREEARKFQTAHADLKGERDTRPGVVAFWQGFVNAHGGPRLWDEDSWPVRFPHNPVQRAFRTVLFARGDAPYVVIVDDIQKDGAERLYEWLMQTGADTELFSLAAGEVVLGDASVKRGPDGQPRPQRGDRQLLVRVLGQGEPAKARDFTTRPSLRLEAFERRDTLVPEEKTGALSGSRSFGLDKRLVVASRSVAPDFRVLLFPHRNGSPLPTTTWNETRTELTVTLGERVDVLGFERGADGRTRVSFRRGGAAPVLVK